MQTKSATEKSLKHMETSTTSSDATINSLNKQINQKLEAKSGYLKWVMLGLTCLQFAATQFGYDNPAAIVYTLEQDFGINQFQYSLLYTVFSIPNLVIPVCFGMILDKIGIKITLLILCFFELLGQSIFCYGGFVHKYKLLIIGRLVLGIGAESIFVVGNYVLSKWFDRNQFSLAYNINNSVGFIALSMNGIILPLIYNTDNMEYLGWALFIGVVLFIIAFIGGYILGVLDEKQEANPDNNESSFSIKEIMNLNYAFWLTGGATVFILASTLSFVAVSTEMMQTLYKIDSITAGRLYSLPYYCLAIFGPAVGLYNSKYGNRLNVAIISAFFLLLCFVFIMILPECEETCYIGILPKIFVSVAYSLYYPTLQCIMPDVVPKKIIGTAFGFQCVFYNLQLMISPMISGYIHDKTSSIKSGYLWESVFWFILTVIGLIFMILLYIENKQRYGGKLNQCTNVTNEIETISIRSDQQNQHQPEQISNYNTFGEVSGTIDDTRNTNNNSHHV